MKNLLLRDQKKRVRFLKKESLRLILKYLHSNQKLSLKIRTAAGFLLQNPSSQTNLVKIKNRCVQTSRGASILRNFRLSRIIFRDYVRFGQIPGIVKKSW